MLSNILCISSVTSYSMLSYIIFTQAWEEDATSKQYCCCFSARSRASSHHLMRVSSHPLCLTPTRPSSMICNQAETNKHNPVRKLRQDLQRHEKHLCWVLARAGRAAKALQFNLYVQWLNTISWTLHDSVPKYVQTTRQDSRSKLVCISCLRSLVGKIMTMTPSPHTFCLLLQIEEPCSSLLWDQAMLQSPARGSHPYQSPPALHWQVWAHGLAAWICPCW